jgi:hypothetical protein
MIEELLHYGSIELCSVLPTQTLWEMALSF